jgi:hypothetical protein
MTDHEMRIRLAEAMGWTDLDWYSRPGWITGLPPGGRPRDHVPSPLEFDTDAARLRAWCVERGWMVILACDKDGASATILETEPSGIGNGHVSPSIEPDPLRRERLALCRAVVQALEAGGEP